MGLLRWYRRRFRYERLNKYPELRGFPRSRTNALVRRYEGEERSTWPWRLTLAGFCLSWMLLIVAMFWGPSLVGEPYADFAEKAVMLLLFVPVGIAAVLLHQGMRKRVSRRVVDELGGGRLRVCLKCGYDLRGTPGEVCSECGASVYLAAVRQG